MHPSPRLWAHEDTACLFGTSLGCHKIKTTSQWSLHISESLCLCLNCSMFSLPCKREICLTACPVCTQLLCRPHIGGAQPQDRGAATPSLGKTYFGEGPNWDFRLIRWRSQNAIIRGGKSLYPVTEFFLWIRFFRFSGRWP